MAHQLIAFFNHITAAFRTRLIGRLLPGHEFTFRIILTSVILSSFFCFAQNYFLTADRTFYADLFQIRLRIAAFRKSRTCQKSSVRTVLDHHVASALLAE